MEARNSEFYDLVGKGLEGLGYGGQKPFEAYVQDMFAEKYNAEKTFANLGFPVNPNIPIKPTYEQLDAEIRPYTIATNVDIDSDGPTKQMDSATLKMGGLPTFKHEVYLSRKVIREQLMLADAIGGTTPEIENTIMSLLFKGVDDLLGGNYNTMKYMRHQIVSNFGVLTISAANNPYGLPLQIDFGVSNAHKTTSTWYTKSSDGTVTQASAVTSGTISPISVARKIRENAENNDFCPQGHWEMSKLTFDALIAMPYFREQYVLATNPIIASEDRLAYGNTVEDAKIKAYLESRIGPIVVIDDIASIDDIDSTTHTPIVTNIQSFKEGVMVYVPNGEIGDIQAGKPIFMETPGARTALYDGGRTLLRQVFNDEQMTQTIKSEFTAIPVPNKVRWFYYLTVMGS